MTREALPWVVATAVVAALAWPGPQGPRHLVRRRGGFARARLPPGPTTVGRRWRGGRRGDAAVQDELAQVLALLSSSLASGVPPTTAVRCVADAVGGDGPIGRALHGLVLAARRGDELGEVWQAHAERLGSADLAFVGRAWTLSERTGAPLAEALRSAEEVLRARRRAQERLAAAAAGPRASMGVLASLPAAGPVVGLTFGVSPASLYLSSALSLGSLGLGVGLGLFGWWWSRRILAAAAREPRPRRPRSPGADSPAPFVGAGALADALVLIALAMRAGLGLSETLTTVGQACIGPVRRDLGAVAAALRWGRSTADAWTYAGPQWRPVALAWQLASETGAAPADLIERSAARLRDEQELAAQRRAARAGVFLVLPLGLGFLPAFACTAVVPVVLVLAGGVAG